MSRIKLVKKLAIGLSGLAYLSSAFRAFADDIVIPTPLVHGKPAGYSNLGLFISNLLILAFGIALLIVLIMLIWGAFEWITSGGDKEAVGKARNRIINALIGLAVLAVAFALAKVAGQFLGFDLGNIPIPTPG